MKRRLVFRASALSDIDHAYRWYEDQQPGLGASFMAAIEQATTRIEDNPQQHARIRVPARRAILQRFPYSIFYISHQDRLSAIAVMHQARHPSRWRIGKAG